MQLVFVCAFGQVIPEIQGPQAWLSPIFYQWDFWKAGHTHARARARAHTHAEGSSGWGWGVDLGGGGVFCTVRKHPVAKAGSVHAVHNHATRPIIPTLSSFASAFTVSMWRYKEQASWSYSEEDFEARLNYIACALVAWGVVTSVQVTTPGISSVKRTACQPGQAARPARSQGSCCNGVRSRTIPGGVE